VNVKETTNMLLKCDLTCPAFFGCGDGELFHCASFVGHNHKLSFTSSPDLRKEVTAPFA